MFGWHSRKGTLQACPVSSPGAADRVPVTVPTASSADDMVGESSRRMSACRVPALLDDLDSDVEFKESTALVWRPSENETPRNWDSYCERREGGLLPDLGPANAATAVSSG